MSNVNILTHSELLFFFSNPFWNLCNPPNIFATLKGKIVVASHRQGGKKSPICTKAGFKPFTVSLSLDYIFYPLIILHIAAGLQF